MMVAFPPALFFPDSWGYISAAYSHSLIGLQSRWPFGYSALIAVLTLPGRDLAQLTFAQHAVGLLCGAGVYLVLIRAGLNRWAAAAAAALVLLDGYAITLEQYVMSDTFAGATVLAVIVLAAWPRLRPGAAAAERFGLGRSALIGLLVAGAILQREASMFIAPALLLYLLWIRIGWRAFAVLMASLLIPLGVYSSLVDSKYHVFGITAASGWTLYGRVAGFADCRDFSVAADERPLCETAAQRASHPDEPDWYIWGPSPAVRLFRPVEEPVDKIAVANATLSSFSQQVILHQPLAMAGATLRDFLHYLTPDVVPFRDAQSATSLPVTVHDESISKQDARRDLPGLRPQVRFPASLLRAYRSLLHVPRPVLALFVLSALLALCLRVPWRREIFLFAGSGVGLLLGTAATGGFALRYLIPAVAPLAIGGSLAVRDLAARWRVRSQARVHVTPPSPVRQSVELTP